MKSIKSILALFVAVLLVSTTTFAQEKVKGAEDRANRTMAEIMSAKFDLSDTQIKQITVIEEEHAQNMRTIRSEATGDRTAIREKMRAAAAERDAAISNVLTEAQREQWASMRGSKRPDKAQRPVKRPDVKRPSMNGSKRPSADAGKRPPKGKSGNKLKKALGLSDAQAKELKKLTKAHQSKIKELKAKGKERKIKKVSKKYQKAVKKLLTPEQFKKWTSIKSQRGKDIIH